MLDRFAFFLTLIIEHIYLFVPIILPNSQNKSWPNSAFYN